MPLRFSKAFEHLFTQDNLNVIGYEIPSALIFVMLLHPDFSTYPLWSPSLSSEASARYQEKSN